VYLTGCDIDIGFVQLKIIDCVQFSVKRCPDVLRKKQKNMLYLGATVMKHVTVRQAVLLLSRGVANNIEAYATHRTVCETD